MCGIFAFLNYDTVTNTKEVITTLEQALKKLALRGYDSAGIGLPDPTSEGRRLITVKTAGSVEKLHTMIEAANIPDASFRNYVAVAHTRWATHGVVSDANAHPIPSDENNEFLVVHNGMVTNSAEIKKMLGEKGVQVKGDTDTEVIAKLTKFLYQQDVTQTFGALIRNVCKYLQGAFAFVFMSSFYPNEVVATSYGSPLSLGVNMYEASPPPQPRNANNQGFAKLGRTDSKSSLIELTRTYSSGSINKSEYFISSDSSTLTPITKTAIQLEDGDLLHFKAGRYQYYNFKDEANVDRTKRPSHLIEDVKSADKAGFAHFMLKEIHEQAEALHNVMRGRIDFDKNLVKLGGIEAHVDEMRFCRRLVFIASASSYHASIAGRHLIEELTGLAVNLELATDFLDRMPSVERNDVCVFISQSGETKDVVKAAEYCKKQHALCVGITNTVGSPLAKTTDCGIYLNVGPEVGIVSTKSYTASIVAITLMALKLGENTLSTQARRTEVIQALKNLPDLMTRTLQKADQMVPIAKKIKDNNSVLVMGRGYQYATCVEGALKLKEFGLHSEGVLSGELKHGPLALVDEQMPIVFVATRDKNYDHARNGFSQVSARGGHPIAICTEGDNFAPEGFDKFEVPATVDVLQTVLNIVPFQLLSYHVATLRGIDVDFSKNLAKIVTV
eukprot:TRINITY_DN843_c0_g1_i1.p1 TRINITY_DN843_c0_g1~~TRINITY_DN843_c0_g1_i1.p1  ORF type:complete len:672 (-),score=211.12 TRINITY_DN843_c0_g1_i1:569-2584(-)